MQRKVYLAALLQAKKKAPTVASLRVQGDQDLPG